MSHPRVTHGSHIAMTSHERHGVSEHQQLECVLNNLFRESSKIHITDSLWRIPPVTGGFPSQSASNAESFSIGWRHLNGAKHSPLCQLNAFYILSDTHFQQSHTYERHLTRCCLNLFKDISCFNGIVSRGSKCVDLRYSKWFHRFSRGRGYHKSKKIIRICFQKKKH